MVEWLYALIISVASPERAATEDAFPGWGESVAERKARFRSIAEDVEAVVFDEDEPTIYRGPQGRAQTAALLLAVAYHESGFMPDVDLGPCYRGKNGKGSRCDSGKAACLMQLHADYGRTPDGHTLDELFKDRKVCLRSGLRLLRRSIGQCRSNPPEYRLAAYASGRCDRGLQASKDLFAIAVKLQTAGAIPSVDEVVLKRKREEKAGKKPAEKASEKPGEKPSSKPSEKPTEKP